MGKPRAKLQSDESRELSSQLARLIIERMAPDELLTFDEIAEEYHKNPQSTLMLNKKEEAVGFGLELVLLTPFALGVAEFIIGFVGELLRDVFKDASKPAVSSALKRVFLGRSDEVPPPPDEVELTDEQRERIFEAATGQATRLGLDENKAVLLGNAIIGVLSNQ